MRRTYRMRKNKSNDIDFMEYLNIKRLIIDYFELFKKYYEKSKIYKLKDKDWQDIYDDLHEIHKLLKTLSDMFPQFSMMDITQRQFKYQIDKFFALEDYERTSMDWRFILTYETMIKMYFEEIEKYYE